VARNVRLLSPGGRIMRWKLRLLLTWLVVGDGGRVIASSISSNNNNVLH
jgi:hypothetical protein